MIPFLQHRWGTGVDFQPSGCRLHLAVTFPAPSVRAFFKESCFAQGTQASVPGKFLRRCWGMSRRSLDPVAATSAAVSAAHLVDFQNRDWLAIDDSSVSRPLYSL
jgi:hypothetical protein